MKMDLVWKILSDGYILIIPIIAWNLIFTSKLPPAYAPKLFNSNIPLGIITGKIYPDLSFSFCHRFSDSVQHHLQKKRADYFFSGSYPVFFILVNAHLCTKFRMEQQCFWFYCTSIHFNYMADRPKLDGRFLLFQVKIFKMALHITCNNFFNFSHLTLCLCILQNLLTK